LDYLYVTQTDGYLTDTIKVTRSYLLSLGEHKKQSRCHGNIVHSQRTLYEYCVSCNKRGLQCKVRCLNHLHQLIINY